MNVIFMGCAKFGIEALNVLYKNFNLKAIFTSYPKQKGRKLILTKSEIEEYASLNCKEIPIFNVKTMRSSEVLTLVNNIEADLIVVVAYGFILPSDILYSKKYGCINIHPSSLPTFRGAAPLQFTILNQLKKSNVCIIQMQEGIDDGDILAEEEFLLDENTNLPILHDICAKIGAKLLINVINNINNIIPKKQVGAPSYARKIKKDDGLITNEIILTKTALQLKAKLLAFDPWPGLFFYFNNVMYKIIECKVEIIDEFIVNTNNLVQINNLDIQINNTITSSASDHNLSFNNLIIDKKNFTFKIKCLNSYLNIIKIQPQGKNSMYIKDFLNGFKY